MSLKPVAIIGAGMAGASAARFLSERGVKCEIYEKSRGWGGRLSTKRVDTADGSFYFDHGAQYFTAYDQRFVQLIEPLLEEKKAAAFQARWTIPSEASGSSAKRQGKKFYDTQRYWMRGGINRLCKEIAQHHTLKQKTVTSLRPEDIKQFSAVISTVPLPQLAKLISLKEEDSLWSCEEHWDPCFALMLGFLKSGQNLAAESLPEAGFLADGLGGEHWFCEQSQRFYPKNSSLSSWVVHASATFSKKYFDRDKEEVARMLLDQCKESVCALRPDSGWELKVNRLHRWRYSKPKQTIEIPKNTFEKQGVFIAGDALRGGRVEGAYLSGLEAAESVLRFLNL